MAHSIKIGNGNETTYSSVPTINAKAIEENYREEMVPLYKLTGSDGKHGSLGLIAGETYIAKYASGSQQYVEYIKAVYNNDLGMVVCNSQTGLFRFGDTTSYIEDGWLRYELTEAPVLYGKRKSPFATINDAISLGIENAKVGQIVKVKSVNGMSEITELEAVDDVDTSPLIVTIDGQGTDSHPYTCSHTLYEITSAITNGRFVIGYTNSLNAVNGVDGYGLDRAYLLPDVKSDATAVYFRYFNWDEMISWKVTITSNNIEVSETQINIT